MTIMQIIYTSQPFGFDEAMLGGILVQARRNNPRWEMTGCLICRQDLYLQLLEGPEAALDTLFNKIKADDRHLEVTLLSRATVSTRMFPDWAMRHDPAQSWLWPPEAVAAGVLFQASPDSLRAVFARVGT